MILLYPSRFLFGEFVLDVGLRQLSGPAGDLHMSPKAFDLLVLLVTNRSRVLSKNELQERLWPDTFVVETNLASLVAEIRGTLKDDAKRPRFVRTAHRIGYAFCGMVTGVADVPPPSSTAAIFCWLLKGGRKISLQPGDNILGREIDGAINLDSPAVSRRHARIRVSANDATLEDLGSKNGTYLHGERVSAPMTLKDGDDLRVGSVALRFRQQSGPRSTMSLASHGRESSGSQH